MKNEQCIMFNTFSNFSELFWNAYIEKLFCKVSVKGRGLFEIAVTNRNGHKNVQSTSLSESSTNGKKTEKLFFLLDNPTLHTNFKWQPLKVAALILIWKWTF